ncbi:helix-turn-helix domain-containing protein [Schaalia sp. ZJ1691]|uniref:helix-turn-helix domain-containing protein n=1 Tax=Schaalia sp. ZJ1691 TaxID=2709404 RepID=UPI0013EBCEC9|nr:helix-turn-helix domain-containing protein [Schaalia sp. ZJ1691]
MTEPQAEPWVTMKDAQEHLGVSRDTVVDWINHRGLPGYKIGRFWKFKLSEIDNWLRLNADNSRDVERGVNA